MKVGGSCAFVLYTTILQYFTPCPSNSEMQKKLYMTKFTHQHKIDVVWNTKNLRPLTLRNDSHVCWGSTMASAWLTSMAAVVLS